MRKSLIAGNWKMHGSLSSVQALINGIKQGMLDTGVEVLILPTFVHLSEAKSLIHGSSILLGAQDLYMGAQGAYTGEVSGSMLKDLGCQYVLIGHSERRSIFHEDLALIAAKFKAAIEAGLTPILCIGETKEEREQNKTETVVRDQLMSVVDVVGIDGLRQAVIAYEPVWAIGTGLTATPQQAQAVHAYIRELISKISVDIANTICILYGGSMKADNAASLLAMADIDGGLIGGASLDAASFLAICAAAKTEKV